MTPEDVEGIIEILAGNYPAEAWKLNGRTGKGFAAAMSKRFAKIETDAVFDALDGVMEENKTMPSVTVIWNAVKNKKNRVPDFKALPEAAAPQVNQQGVKRAKEMLNRFRNWHNMNMTGPGAKQPWHWPPSASEREIKALSKFAATLFPDITESQIATNFDVFREQYRLRGWLDGHRTKLVIDKYTGLVDQFVVIKGEQEK